MEFLRLLVPAFFACLCNALANMFWKLRFDAKPLAITNINDFLDLIFNTKIILGMSLYGISMLLFFYMLSNFKLSIIIPVTCMTYVFNILIAYFIFNEKLSANQIIGTATIMVGLVIISQTKSII